MFGRGLQKWYIDVKYVNLNLVDLKLVGNKAKWQISKRLLQENKACQIFRKNEHFLPPDIHTCVGVSGVRNVRFLENLACFVFFNIRFEIRPFSLLPTNNFDCIWTLLARLPQFWLACLNLLALFSVVNCFCLEISLALHNFELCLRKYYLIGRAQLNEYQKF